MAAASSDQENGLLQCDERNPSAPPPAGRLPIKVPLAVGLCVFAAGLAGAVIMGRPAARVPTKIKNPWAAISMNGFQYISTECQTLLEALEQEAEEEGRVHEGGPGETAADCKETEQICTAGFGIFGEVQEMTKCFPITCKQANIFKELEANMADSPPEAEVTGLDVSCVVAGEAEEDEAGEGGNLLERVRDASKEYLSDECTELLDALEKEAEEEGRKHEVDPRSGETLDCKASEQACTVTFSMYGESISGSKCFPATCKPDNIFKGIEEEMDTLPADAQIAGLNVVCAPDESTVRSEPWMQYLSDECHELLMTLEKEAEEEGRTHEAQSAETLDCKESEQACTVTMSMDGESMTASKCFPDICKEENIFKGLEDDMGDEALSGMSISCGEPRTGKGRRM
jgi:hypothetical protein